jgi:hypothetical protein
VYRITDGAEQMPDLIFRQRLRKPLLPWLGDLFSSNSPKHDQVYGDRRTATRNDWKAPRAAPR